jgi:2-phosphosulfolactate phosphatase
MYYSQSEFEIRCEWGIQGVRALAPTSDVVIIVDVLSFSTCVGIAVERGAIVFPYNGSEEKAPEFAASVHALLAHPRRAVSQLSLSPHSFMNILPGTRIVLPSLNGSRLALAAGLKPVLAGCLRNARAIALAAKDYGSKIAVIPAGERWQDDHSLRPSFEDLVGAGAIIQYLDGSLSPEAAGALACFRGTSSTLYENLHDCGSGRELIERGFEEDVRLAAQLNVSSSVPRLLEGAFRGSTGRLLANGIPYRVRRPDSAPASQLLRSSRNYQPASDRAPAKKN